MKLTPAAWIVDCTATSVKLLIFGEEVVLLIPPATIPFRRLPVAFVHWFTGSALRVWVEVPALVVLSVVLTKVVDSCRSTHVLVIICPLRPLGLSGCPDLTVCLHPQVPAARNHSNVVCRAATSRLASG